jgi:hypothetical protein
MTGRSIMHATNQWILGTVNGTQSFRFLIKPHKENLQ